jgi:hypothetical protein
MEDIQQTHITVLMKTRTKSETIKPSVNRK